MTTDREQPNTIAALCTVKTVNHVYINLYYCSRPLEHYVLTDLPLFVQILSILVLLCSG